MDQICLAVPIVSGKVDAARDFMRQLETERKGDYARSEQRIGISKEAWFLAPLPSGEHLIAYMESADFQVALGMFSQSQDEFDLWFKERLADATGLDLNNRPPDMQMPELLSSYEA